MTYGSKEDGSGYLLLTPEENEAFKKGKPIKKISGDCHGIFRILAKITRPRSKDKRFPASCGYDGVSGQDRKSYSDTQDRDSYTPSL